MANSACSKTCRQAAATAAHVNAWQGTQADSPTLPSIRREARVRQASAALLQHFSGRCSLASLRRSWPSCNALQGDSGCPDPSSGGSRRSETVVPAQRSRGPAISALSLPSPALLSCLGKLRTPLPGLPSLPCASTDSPSPLTSPPLCTAALSLQVFSSLSSSRGPSTRSGDACRSVAAGVGLFG